jgi:hypothetical protein
VSLSPNRITESIPSVSIAALALLVSLGFTATAQAQTKKAAAPAAKPAAPAAKPATPAAKPAGGATTAGHTTTTTAGHTTTTTAGHTTTASHTTTTTTTAHTTTAAGGTHTVTSTTKTTTTVSHTGGPVGRTPVGSHEVHTANGSVVRTRANGSRADIHDSRRGMDIHHGLDGNRRVSVERADHSRVYAERGGRGYVQHPYMYHGREYGHRTYYDHGRYYDRYYNRYAYRGVYMDVYAPVRYYPVGFYGWAYNPWAVPVVYPWGWGAAPWYGFYGAYFAPYPVYPSAAFWLTDYLIATSLQAAYAAQAADAQAAAVAAANTPPALTPDVKQMVADEVKRQIALENSEAAANAQNQQPDPASSSIARMLSDNQPHVFIAGTDLDVVDTSGVECPISQGDIVEVTSAPPADAAGATAVVLASKGGKECAKADHVTIAFNDLQDMQNHMRETIDTGMGDLQSKQGKGGLPAAPPSATAAPVQAAFAVGAPPPDTTASTEIATQTQAADQAEQEVASATPAAGPADTTASAPIPPPAAPAAAPTTIALGQTVDQVTASLGQPTRIIDLGTKKVYVYKDMKITFKAGKVSDVE